MNDVCRPVFAIMNPELTYTVSKYQTGSGNVRKAILKIRAV